jgi:hypothetical protein
LHDSTNDSTHDPERWPIVWILTILLAANGLGSVLQGVTQLLGPAHRTTEGIVAIVVGLLFLFRAYGIWNRQPLAWIVTVALFILRAISAIAFHLENPRLPDMAVNLTLLILLAAGLIYAGTRPRTDRSS